MFPSTPSTPDSELFALPLLQASLESQDTRLRRWAQTEMQHQPIPFHSITRSSLEDGLAQDVAIYQELERDMLEIANRMCVLGESITKRRALLSPIRHIPSEIISEVFLYLDPIYPTNALDILRCMQVCQKWRRIALATPQLWCQVQFTDRTEPSLRVDCMKRWISNSGNCGIHIAFSSFLNSRKAFPQCLINRAAQWETLRFQNEHRGRLLGRSVSGLLNALQSANRLRSISWSSELERTPEIHIPSVTHLVIRSLPNFPPLQLSTLARLEIEGIFFRLDFENWLDEVARRFPNLQTFGILQGMIWLEDPRSPVNESDSRSRPQLSNLRTFSATFGEKETACRRHMKVVERSPNLRSLISCYTNVRRYAAKILPGIESIKIVDDPKAFLPDVTPDVHWPINTFVMFPNLTTLELLFHNPDFNEGAPSIQLLNALGQIYQFGITSDPTCICPQLRTLVLDLKRTVLLVTKRRISSLANTGCLRRTSIASMGRIESMQVTLLGWDQFRSDGLISYPHMDWQVSETQGLENEDEI